MHRGIATTRIFTIKCESALKSVYFLNKNCTVTWVRYPPESRVSVVTMGIEETTSGQPRPEPGLIYLYEEGGGCHPKLVEIWTNQNQTEGLGTPGSPGLTTWAKGAERHRRGPRGPKLGPNKKDETRKGDDRQVRQDLRAFTQQTCPEMNWPYEE